jgi:hypothetical protein
MQTRLVPRHINMYDSEWDTIPSGQCLCKKHILYAVKCKWTLAEIWRLHVNMTVSKTRHTTFFLKKRMGKIVTFHIITQKGMEYNYSLICQEILYDVSTATYILMGYVAFYDNLICQCSVNDWNLTDFIFRKTPQHISSSFKYPFKTSASICQHPDCGHEGSHVLHIILLQQYFQYVTP